MIGYNPVNDMRGARGKINAVALQKIHEGVEVGIGLSEPDAVFCEFSELRNLIEKIGVQK